MLSVSKKNVVVTLSVSSGLAAVTAVGAMLLEAWNRRNNKRVSQPKRVAQAMSLATVLSVAGLVSVIYLWDDSEASDAEEKFRDGIVSPSFVPTRVPSGPANGAMFQTYTPGLGVLGREATRRIANRVRVGPFQL